MFLLLALFATAWASIATSVNGLSGTSTYELQTDCTTPPQTAVVTVTNGQIISPAGKTFLDFGLPQQNLGTDDFSFGPMGDIVRTCRRSVGDSALAGERVISCFDQGELVCNLYLRKMD